MSNKRLAKLAKRKRGWLTWRQSVKAGLVRNSVKVSQDHAIHIGPNDIIDDSIRHFSKKIKMLVKASDIIIGMIEDDYANMLTTISYRIVKV